jgi:hypothetical protein
VLSNLKWSKPFLRGCTYPMTELSLLLCVCPWLSYYVKRQWDEFLHHIPSCQALNAASSRGPSASIAYPLLKASGCVDRTPGPCPESRREAEWADRWKNPTYTCPSSSAWSDGTISGIECVTS